MNPDKQTKALGDIYYEVMMLHRAFAEYWTTGLRATRTWHHNAVLEATLIHIRALLDFFQRRRTGPNAAKPDDVLATDYGFPVTSFAFAADLSTRINKRMAHLTYARTDVRDDDRPWAFDQFVPQILDRSREFFMHVLDTNPDSPAEFRQLILELTHESA